MDGGSDGEGLRDKLSRQGEEALGRLAEELAGNPIVSSALAGAFEARERAVAAQEAAMGALGIPSAADIERLTRRVRSVSQRLEGIEDAIDRLDDRLASLDETAGAGRGPSDALERRLDDIKADLTALRDQLGQDSAGPGAGTARKSPGGRSKAPGAKAQPRRTPTSG
jgi:septal ring factor EnvC (AmiA/AmiB activator)